MLKAVERKERVKAGYPQEMRQEGGIGQHTRNRTVTTGNVSYSGLTREGSKCPRQAHGERIKGPIGNYRGKTKRMVGCIRNARDNTGDTNDVRRLMYHGLIVPSKAGAVAMALVASCYFYVTFGDLVKER